MRAKEFVINIPISITLNGDGEPTLSMPGIDPNQPGPGDGIGAQGVADDEDIVFVPPLQQQIELAKEQSGKESTVIDQITADDDADRHDNGSTSY